MNQQDPNILVANAAGTVIIRLLGDIRYTISTAFRDYLEALTHDREVRAIIFDLTETTNIDSTNLGLLAKVANYSRQHLHRKSVIVSENNDINEVLRSVGFDRVFQVVPHFDMPSAQLEQLQPESVSREQLSKVLLEAHKALMGLNEKNRVMFRDVVKALEAQR